MVTQDPKSPAKHYLEMTNDKKWNFATCAHGFSHAILIVILCVRGIFSCESSSDGYLKTFATDDYCLENPNLWMYRTLIFFCAYCTVDLLLCLILVNDHKG